MLDGNFVQIEEKEFILKKEPLFAWLIQKSSQIKFYTYISDVFQFFPDILKKYDWLISDYECNYYPSPLKINTDVFITFDDIEKMQKEDEPQFIWAIISSIKKGERFDISDNQIWSDGNPDFWSDNLHIQNQNSEIEIVCWDSSAFIFMTTNLELSNRFVLGYPDAIDLFKFNAKIKEKRYKK